MYKITSNGMNKKNLPKSILVVAILAGVIWAGYYFIFSSEDKAGNTVADNTFGWKYPVTKFPTVGPNPNELAYSDIRDPGGIPEGLPVRLKIPVIGVDSFIEDALITPDGRMDVPSGSVNVAWFALGPNPGQVGSAVIGGHFGIRNGVKFVFYDLDKLIVGDKIYIEDDKGDIFTFVVRSIKLFDRNADATTVFTSDDGLAHLNLITCEGIWNRVNDSYPERRVVFADLMLGEEETVVSIASTYLQVIPKAQDLTTFYRSLRVGMRGADVVALQNALKQVGISPGAIDGAFGPVTRVAVAQYQASAGLSPDGVFGPFTKTKLLSELGGDTDLPNAGTEKIVSFKNLFATPIDGLITSLLLIAIVFVTLKIILRRF